MTPTGSWPRTSPGRTGYSPFTMWTSVPQIVVSVTRISASPAPGRGRATSSTLNSCGAWNTLARMVSIAIIATSLQILAPTRAGCGALNRVHPSIHRQHPDGMAAAPEPKVTRGPVGQPAVAGISSVRHSTISA